MRTHITAIIALGSLPTFPGFDGGVDDGTLPNYWFITAPTFRPDRATLDADGSDLSDYFQVTAVGADADSARWAQEHLKTALDRKNPTVSGFLTFCERTASGSVNPDHSVSLPGTGNPFYSVDTYRYTATPIA